MRSKTLGLQVEHVEENQLPALTGNGSSSNSLAAQSHWAHAADTLLPSHHEDADADGVTAPLLSSGAQLPSACSAICAVLRGLAAITLRRALPGHTLTDAYAASVRSTLCSAHNVLQRLQRSA